MLASNERFFHQSDGLRLAHRQASTRFMAFLGGGSPRYGLGEIGAVAPQQMPQRLHVRPDRGQHAPLLLVDRQRSFARDFQTHVAADYLLQDRHRCLQDVVGGQHRAAEALSRRFDSPRRFKLLPPAQQRSVAHLRQVNLNRIRRATVHSSYLSLINRAGSYGKPSLDGTTPRATWFAAAASPLTIVDTTSGNPSERRQGKKSAFSPPFFQPPPKRFFELRPASPRRRSHRSLGAGQFTARRAPGFLGPAKRR